METRQDRNYPTLKEIERETAPQCSTFRKGVAIGVLVLASLSIDAFTGRMASRPVKASPSAQPTPIPTLTFKSVSYSGMFKDKEDTRERLIKALQSDFLDAFNSAEQCHGIIFQRNGSNADFGTELNLYQEGVLFPNGYFDWVLWEHGHLVLRGNYSFSSSFSDYHGEANEYNGAIVIDGIHFVANDVCRALWDHVKKPGGKID